MYDWLQHLRMLAEARYAPPQYELEEIEQTIAELELYLETYPNDEIALIQLAQYTRKREVAATHADEGQTHENDTEMRA